jgi:serine/threonine protein kinase
MTLQIPNYLMKRLLGKGGMAMVYLSEHRLLHSEVALKVLNPEFVRNNNIRARFLAEARSLARMSHPHIVKVTDLIDEGDTVAFVMEYIEGETLKEHLERKDKLKDDEIGNLFEQMLSALEYVHDQGLVHRDIKPSNFMVTPLGKLKLMDFGIAKQTNPTSPDYTSTGTNQQMGTALYMSPEQIRETRSVTACSDIYSLGVVLWQMVSGKRPYSSGALSTFDLQLKIINEPLPLTETKWDSIIQKSTAKDVKLRYVSINALRSSWLKVQYDLNKRKESEFKKVIEEQSNETNFRSSSIKIENLSEKMIELQDQNVIGLGKFAFLSFITFGLYDLWWLYKSKKLLDKLFDFNILIEEKKDFFLPDFFNRIKIFVKNTGYSHNDMIVPLLFFYFLIKIIGLFSGLFVIGFFCLIPLFISFKKAMLLSDYLIVIQQNKFSAIQNSIIFIGIVFWINLTIQIFWDWFS